ncbi:MAG: hypothetical protein SGILL_003746, partial [Bacillariaceae sp.]
MSVATWMDKSMDTIPNDLTADAFLEFYCFRFYSKFPLGVTCPLLTIREGEELTECAFVDFHQEMAKDHFGEASKHLEAIKSSSDAGSVSFHNKVGTAHVKASNFHMDRVRIIRTPSDVVTEKRSA